MKNKYVLVVGTFLATLILSFLCEAGIVWVICWALKAIGVTTIFGWTVAFSWPLTLLFWIASWMLNGLFSHAKSK